MAKKLLNEAVVRRFQSLANISPINEMSYKEEKEDKMEEGLEEAEMTPEQAKQKYSEKMGEYENLRRARDIQDPNDPDLMAIEKEMKALKALFKESTLEETYLEADEEPGDAPEMPEMEDEMGESMDVDLTEEEAQMIIELGEKLAAAMGEGEPEMPDEMDAPPMPDDMGGEEDELMETLSEIDYVPSQGEIVNEVARRVARRLAEAQKAEKRMNEALGRK